MRDGTSITVLNITHGVCAIAKGTSGLKKPCIVQDMYASRTQLANIGESFSPVWGVRYIGDGNPIHPINKETLIHTSQDIFAMTSFGSGKCDTNCGSSNMKSIIAIYISTSTICLTF